MHVTDTEENYKMVKIKRNGCVQNWHENAINLRKQIRTPTALAKNTCESVIAQRKGPQLTGWTI